MSEADDLHRAETTLRPKLLFAEFSDVELRTFVELADPVHCIEGTLVVRQDETGDCMFILVEGQAQVRHRHNKRGQRFELARLGGGDFFGELALVDEGPRIADVLALSDCFLLKVTPAGLHALMAFHPTVALKIFMAVARAVVNRVRRTNARYIDSMVVLERKRLIGDTFND